MRIYVKGYFSVNLGDDLFIRTLAERYPQCQFELVTEPQNAVPYLDVPNLTVIRRNRWFFFANKILNFFSFPWNLLDMIEKRCDITVVIGGSIFQQITGSKREIRAASRLARGVNPTYIVGANFGPYTTEEYKYTVEICIKNANDVCFRDLESFEFFRNNPNIRYAPDILFGLEYASPQKPKEQYCFISVIDFGRRNSLAKYKDSYICFMNRAIEYYLGQGKNVVLTSFCRNEGDESAINNIIQCLDQEKLKKVSVLTYNGRNAREILASIQNASCIVATRFHSMIMGLSCKVPLIPVVYNKKIMTVLQDIGCEEYGVLPESMDQFCFEDANYLVYQDVGRLKANAELHFDVLDKVLNKEKLS